MKLLLTGFEPFGGSRVNPSEQVVQALAGRTFTRIQLHTAILSVNREQGPAQLLEAVRAVEPEAVLCLGLAERRPALSVERLAINLLDFGIADNSGRQEVDRPIVSGGPAAYFVTLPVRALVTAIRAAGVPAELSLSAGTFLCNQVLYTLLHNLTPASIPVPPSAGFIHLPALPEQATQSPLPMASMSLDTMLKGISAAIETLGAA
jgi:pyroglutamyl-peptidase